MATPALPEQDQDQMLRDMKSEYRYGFNDDFAEAFRVPKGLNEEVIRAISEYKKEPEWVLDFRLKALQKFLAKPMPKWGPEFFHTIDFQDITYFVSPDLLPTQNWDDIPDKVKETFERIGVPRAEQEYLAGSAGQYDSTVAYHKLKDELSKQGVIFLGMDEAIQQHPDLVKQYLGTVVPIGDNFAAALNSAAFSGGSFVYVPAGVQIELPLSAYFRINSSSVFQGERTLIIAEEGSRVSYAEGCLVAGEQVSLGYKWANVESIKPGQKVVGEDGKLHKVKASMARNYKGKAIHIKTASKVNSLRVTPNHPVKVVKRSSVSRRHRNPDVWLSEVTTKDLLKAVPSYVEAGQVERGDFLVFPKVKSGSDKSAFSIDMMTFMGYYVAEGSCHHNKANNGYTVNFTFHENEDDLIEEVQDLAEKLAGTRGSVSHAPKRHAKSISIYSRDLLEILTEHCGRGSRYKELSEKVMASPLANTNAFLRSYFLGDGSVDSRNRKGDLVRASTASRGLAVQLQELMARDGIYATIQIRPAGEDYFQGRKIYRNEQYILAYVRGGGWSQVRDAGDYFLIPVTSVESEDYDGAVFNLEVEGSHTYCVKGFATHNCSAPSYVAQKSIHAAVVEIIVKKDAEVHYFTTQSWDPESVYNLVVKRAVAYENAKMFFTSAELGSVGNSKYPGVILRGRGAHAEINSIAYAGKGQVQDTGGKLIMVAPETSGTIISKSISQADGVATYRGLVKIGKNATGAKVKVVCDALLLDDKSVTNTYPTMEIGNDRVEVEHEATVSKVGEEQLFYLMSRGIPEEEAMAMIVNGFIEPVVKELPMEYAVEIGRLMELQMEGSVG